MYSGSSSNIKYFLLDYGIIVETCIVQETILKLADITRKLEGLSWFGRTDDPERTYFSYEGMTEKEADQLLDYFKQYDVTAEHSFRNRTRYFTVKNDKIIEFVLPQMKAYIQVMSESPNKKAIGIYQKRSAGSTEVLALPLLDAIRYMEKIIAPHLEEIQSSFSWTKYSYNKLCNLFNSNGYSNLSNKLAELKNAVYEDALYDSFTRNNFISSCFNKVQDIVFHLKNTDLNVSCEELKNRMTNFLNAKEKIIEANRNQPILIWNEPENEDELDSRENRLKENMTIPENSENIEQLNNMNRFFDTKSKMDVECLGIQHSLKKC
jgi:hypothetical protein